MHVGRRVLKHLSALFGELRVQGSTKEWRIRAAYAIYRKGIDAGLVLPI